MELFSGDFANILWIVVVVALLFGSRVGAPLVAKWLGVSRRQASLYTSALTFAFLLILMVFRAIDR